MAKLDSTNPKKKKRNLPEEPEDSLNLSSDMNLQEHSPKKQKKDEDNTEEIASENVDEIDEQKAKKRKNSKSVDDAVEESELNSTDASTPSQSTDNTNENDGKSEKKPKYSDKTPKKLSVIEKIKDRKKNKGPEEVSDKPKEVIPQKEYVPRKSLAELTEKFPILKNIELVKKYQAVPLNNNQKGRIRQQFVSCFKSTAIERIPDAINLKLEELLSKEDLGDSDYRKIRILHNMLKTSVMRLVRNVSPPAAPKEESDEKEKNPKPKQKTDEKEMTHATEEEEDDDEKDESDEDSSEESDSDSDSDDDDDDEEEEQEDKDPEEKDEKEPEGEKKEEGEEKGEKVKVKGPKRYVVFVGNLPYDIEKETIMRHFSNVVSKIKDVRIPKNDKKKGGIAYIELADDASYEMALSKHHSMLENRRINVLYTTTGRSKIDKKEAKGKRAKLLALQKSGQLLGSAPQSSKRSARRKRQRLAQAKQQAG